MPSPLCPRITPRQMQDTPTFFNGLLTPGALIADPLMTNRHSPRTIPPGENTLPRGKYKGQTFSKVCQHYPEYLAWLLSQPVGMICPYIPFVTFCTCKAAPFNQHGASASGRTVFPNGKYRLQTYANVRQQHPDYFGWLLAQPAGAVYTYLPFISYCFEYLTADDCE